MTRLVLPLACLAAAGLAAADLAVANRHLRVEYRAADRSLRLADARSGAVFATADAFAPPDATVAAEPFRWRSFACDALRLTRPDGACTLVMLAPDAPFAFVQHIVRGGDAATVTNRVPYPALTLDLGRSDSRILHVVPDALGPGFASFDGQLGPRIGEVPVIFKKIIVAKRFDGVIIRLSQAD